MSGKDSASNPLYIHTHTHTHTHIYIYIERERQKEEGGIDLRHSERIRYVITEGFEAESFPLKYNDISSEYKIHSVKVDLHYFK